MRYKLFCFSLILFYLAPTTQSQTLNIPGNGKITLKEVNQDTVYFIPFKIINIPSSKDVTVELTDLNGMSADRGKDYDYTDNTLKSLKFAAADNPYFSIGIIIKSRKIQRDTISFQLSLSYITGKGRENQIITITIDPQNHLHPIKQIPDTSRFSVRIITGSNFDFFETPTFKNFAGDLHIFLPDLWQIIDRKNKKKKLSIGLEAGIFNFRYFDADSSNGRIVTERYLTDPAISKLVIDTTSYVREVYALNQRTTYNTFGAYLNPIFTLTQSKWVDAYLNLHFEGLWRTEILEYQKSSLSKDTMLLSQQDMSQNIVLQSSPGLRPKYNKKTLNDAYIGIGFPVRVNVKNLFNFYVAPTFGIAVYEGTEITEQMVNNIKYRTFTNKNFREFFLLTKAKLVTTIAPVDIALGGEFRRIMSQRSFYAVYLGAVLSLDKLKK